MITLSANGQLAEELRHTHIIGQRQSQGQRSRPKFKVTGGPNSCHTTHGVSLFQGKSVPFCQVCWFIALQCMIKNFKRKTDNNANPQLYFAPQTVILRHMRLLVSLSPVWFWVPFLLLPFWNYSHKY